MEIVSRYRTRARDPERAASTASRSVTSTKAVETPPRARTVEKRLRVVPYSARVATIRSPAATCDATARWIAAIPVAAANPASAPWSAAKASARTSTVGLPNRA